MFTDRGDQILTELRGIRKQLGGLDDEDGPGENAVWQGLRTFKPGEWVIDETAALDEANDDGTITLNPGEQKTIAEAHHPNADAIGLLSVGAADEQNVRYFIRIDSKYVVGGVTNSPLGSVNSPFSFPDYYNAIIPADQRIEYVAQRPTNASGAVDLVARLTTQVMA